MEPKIVFEDESILVLEKPAGMVVNRAETTAVGITVQDWVENYLKIQNPKSKTQNKSKILNSNDQNNFLNRAGIVHRLDKETSGLLLAAKTPRAFESLQRQFKERKVKKRYLALVHGKVAPEEGEIKAPVGRLPWNRERFGVFPGGREAETKYKVIRYQEPPTSHPKPRASLGFGAGFSLLELSPRTGRTHQIRVHLKYLGHPVVADEFYAGRKTSREDRKWCPRLFLHASYLGFFRPKTGKWREFESELPEELKKVIV